MAISVQTQPDPQAVAGAGTKGARRPDVPRLEAAPDDATVVAAENRARADSGQAIRNVRSANEALTRLQQMDQGMNAISQTLERMRALATQAASGGSAQDRGVLNAQFQKLLHGVTQQAQTVALDTGGRVAAAVGAVVATASSPEKAAPALRADLGNDLVDGRGLGLKPDNVLATRADGTSMVASSATGLGSGHEPFRFTGLSSAGAVAERQVLSLSAADATGKVQSVSVTLDTGNAANAEKAVSTLNRALSEDPTLRNVVAQREPTAQGKDGVRFVSSLPSFHVDVGSATSLTSFEPIGLHDGSGGPAQGITVDSARLGAADLSTASNAQRALSMVDAAQQRVERTRANATRLQGQVVQTQEAPLASKARQDEINAAAAQARATRSQLLQTGAAVANTHGNASHQAVLALLRG